MAEFDAGGVAAMFSADTDFEFGVGFSSQFDADFDQFTGSASVEGLEGIGFEDTLADVIFEEFSGVVAGEAHAHVGEVVGAEGEEFGFLGDFIGGDGGAGYFDHGADEVFDFSFFLFEDLVDFIDDMLFDEG